MKSKKSTTPKPKFKKGDTINWGNSGSFTIKKAEEFNGHVFGWWYSVKEHDSWIPETQATLFSKLHKVLA